jgi:hypothetical protein
VLAGANGWCPSGDGSTAMLEGALCEDAKSGAFTEIDFPYGSS